MDNQNEKHIAVIILPAETAKGYYIPKGCEIMMPKPISQIIRRMAKAMCRTCDCGSGEAPCEPWCDVWTAWVEDATAALCAIVGATTGKNIKKDLKELPIIAPGFGGPAKIVEKKRRK